MSNKLYELVERFYRSSYGMHRFLENYLGLEMTVYTHGIANKVVPRPNPNDFYEKSRKTYGPAFNLTASYSPTGTARVMMQIYSISREHEMTNELGTVKAYTFENKINIGDYLTTTIDSKKIAFKVISKKVIGYSKQVVYALELSPVAVNEMNKIISNN
ncbi:MAG: hypothetical protein NZZ41_06920 [Candidatus Dojkabacteria bacterium]|nr:hypothetical protein [Candidatus Dojkabacteria bacterium]